jgi:hypothetical protein
MERPALVMALALTLPLAIYGVPYAYATVSSATYTVGNFFTVPAHSTANLYDSVCNSGDYVTGGGVNAAVGNGNEQVLGSIATRGDNPTASPPDRWTGIASNPSGISDEVFVGAVCQTPITVAGVGVPEFGSLYVVIALGAVVYFMLSRRFARRPTISLQG